MNQRSEYRITANGAERAIRIETKAATDVTTAVMAGRHAVHLAVLHYLSTCRISGSRYQWSSDDNVVRALRRDGMRLDPTHLAFVLHQLVQEGFIESRVRAATT